MSPLCILDLPYAVHTSIVLELELGDPSHQDVLNFCMAHTVFQRYLTGVPPMTISFSSELVSSVAEIHDIFITRCSYILLGLCLYQYKYCNSNFAAWLNKFQKSVGLKGIAEMIYRLLRFEYVELLCGESPPTVDQLDSLVEEEHGNFMAAYLVIVEVKDPLNKDNVQDYLQYYGTATRIIDAFKIRARDYRGRTTVPEFIQKLERGDDDSFDIRLTVPLCRVFDTDQYDADFGDMRVPILLLETLLSLWNRSFKRGSKWETIMSFSPWTADDMLLVRCNKVMSTRFEWPLNLFMTSEDTTLLKQERAIRAKADRKKEAERRKTPAGKEWDKEYSKAWRKTPVGKASVARSHARSTAKTKAALQAKRAQLGWVDGRTVEGRKQRKASI